MTRRNKIFFATALGFGSCGVCVLVRLGNGTPKFRR